jgi:hypothetical protein
MPLGCRLLLGVLGFSTAAGCVAVIWFSNLLVNRDKEREANCARYLSIPISSEIVNNLCEHRLIPTHMAACSSNSAQLQNKDVEAIMRANVHVGSSTYEAVNHLFPKYIEYCEPEIVKQKFPTFSCTYDISGIGPRITIYYNSVTDVVEAIRVPSCSGS